MSVTAPPAVVVLDEVRHGVLDADDGSRALDAALEAAREAERTGAAAVVVPASPRWPATAQALAVLLATTRVRVVVEIAADGADPGPLARFATAAARLAGDRLVLRVSGERAGVVAEQLHRRWDGPVVVGADGVADLLATVALAA